MANVDTRDGRTQGKEGRSARRLGRGARASGTPGISRALRSRTVTKSNIQSHVNRDAASLSLRQPMASAARKLKADFPSHDLVKHTLQKLLKQTERTLLGLLSFISIFPRSCFLVLELLFDVFGSLFSRRCVVSCRATPLFFL